MASLEEKALEEIILCGKSSVHHAFEKSSIGGSSRKMKVNSRQYTGQFLTCLIRISTGTVSRSVNRLSTGPFAPRYCVS